MTQRLSSDQPILRRGAAGTWSLHAPDAASDEPPLLIGEAEAMPGGEWTRPNARDYAIALDAAAARDRKLRQIADQLEQLLISIKHLAGDLSILKGHMQHLQASTHELAREVRALDASVSRAEHALDAPRLPFAN